VARTRPASWKREAGSVADLNQPRPERAQRGEGRTGLTAAWLGFALAGLFLYPLAAALADNPFYLQWQLRNLAETVIAAVVLAVAFSAGVYYSWPHLTRRSNAVLAGLSLFPIASLLAGVLQQLPFDAALIRAWENPALRYGLPVGVVAMLAIVFVRWPVVFGRWLRRGLLAVSLVALVAARVFIASAWSEPVTTSVERTSGSVGTGCRSILALLFDELSSPYIYDGANLAWNHLSADATHYRQVTAPGRETLISMPGYLAGRSLHDVRVEGNGFMEIDSENQPKPFDARAPDGLFATARRAGLRTEMAGYYLPYCEWLGDLVDSCESYSFYNVAGVRTGFSPLHPIETTLILWPRQFPFGLIKNPPFARLQRDLVARTLAYAQRPLDPRVPTFRFVHFSIPHLPFVFDAEGFNPSRDPLRTSPDDLYVRQTQYVDGLVDAVLAHMRAEGSYDRTTLVILSDHGFRFGGRDRDPRHIPFLVKEAGQTEGRGNDEPHQAAELLRDLVADSCR
jgi:hypothetical protein